MARRGEEEYRTRLRTNNEPLTILREQGTKGANF